MLIWSHPSSCASSAGLRTPLLHSQNHSPPPGVPASSPPALRVCPSSCSPAQSLPGPPQMSHLSVQATCIRCLGCPVPSAGLRATQGLESESSWSPRVPLKARWPLDADCGQGPILHGDQDRVKDKEGRSCLPFREPFSPVATVSRCWDNVNYA